MGHVSYVPAFKGEKHVENVLHVDVPNLFRLACVTELLLPVSNLLVDRTFAA